MITRLGRSLRSGGKQRQTRVAWEIWCGAGLFVIVAGVAATIGIKRDESRIEGRREMAAAPPVRWPAWDTSWSSLERPPSPYAATVDVALGPYAFAATQSRIMAQMPCSCGCRREGHRSVLNCFVSGRTPSGTPIWNDHAFTCPICINIARDVAVLLARGHSVPEIKRQIKRHYQATASEPQGRQAARGRIHADTVHMRRSPYSKARAQGLDDDSI
jgi:hypothetical protein